MKKHKLGISEKNFIYNIILTILICLIIFAYLAFFMPKVYLETKIRKNEENIIEVHQRFIEDKSYASLKPKLKDNMISLFKPKDSDKIHLSTISLDSKLKLKNKQMLNLLEYLERASKVKFDNKRFFENIDAIIEDLKKTSSNYFDLESYKSLDLKSDDDILVKKVKDFTIIKSKSISKERSAHSFMVISYDNDGMYISIYPFIFDDISDIKDTVLKAFPIIFLLIIVIIFLLNRYYSKMITKPIEQMSNFTRQYKNTENVIYDLDISTNDEIEQLSNDIKDLYQSLTQNYKKLEKTSKQREIFIKSASHELKTPLQAAMLLNDGMIENIGKYKDRDKYLPELKQKLVKMQILIEDLLYLNKLDENLRIEEIDLRLILEESINNHSNLLEKKNIKVSIVGNLLVETDYDHFRVIFDNLIKNAIEYTDKNGYIDCKFSDTITISNYPTYINKDILENINKAYVSSKSSKSRGVGMYIVDNLLDAMDYGMDVSYENQIFKVKIKKIKLS